MAADSFSPPIRDILSPLPYSRTTPSPANLSTIFEEQFIWPEPLSTIGLNEQDVSILEMAIRIIRETKLQDGRTDFWISKPNMSIVRTQTALGKEIDYALPRTITVERKTSFVLLRKEQALPGQGQRPGIKGLNYCPDDGKMYWEKRALSIAEEMIILFIAIKAPLETIKGFTKIPYFEFLNKRRYYEEQHDCLLEELDRTPEKKRVEINAFLPLQRALHAIHLLTYTPPAIQLPNNHRLPLGKVSHCYHGNISPETIVCKLGKGVEGQVISIHRLMLTGWSGALRPQYIRNIPGWTSPECIKFAKDSHTTKEKETFYPINGTKKDIWAFGLLAGSLLKKGFFPMTPTSVLLPNFSFLLRRITVQDDGTLDDSAVAYLEQEEIDEELKKIVSKLNTSTPKGRWYTDWWRLIGKWLQVDPENRQDLGESCLNMPVDTK